ncbi:MAG: ATP-binding protein [Spirochaetota bacterium]
MNEMIRPVRKRKLDDDDYADNALQRRNLELSFREMESEAPYRTNLEELDDRLALHSMRTLLLLAEKPSGEDHCDSRTNANTVRLLKSDPEAAMEARRRVDVFAAKAAVRRGLSGFVPGIEALSAEYGLDHNEQEMLFAVFASNFEGTDIYLSELVFRYSATIEERLAIERYFSRNSTLIRSSIIYSNKMRNHNPELIISAAAENRILGITDVAEELSNFTRLVEPKVRWENVILDAEKKERLLALVENHADYLTKMKALGYEEIISYGTAAVLLFQGKSGTGKTMLAYALAQRLGRRVLSVSIDDLNHEGRRGFADHLRMLLTEAKMHNAIVFFDEGEDLLADRRAGNGYMSDVLREIERYDGIVIFATNLGYIIDEAMRRRILMTIDFDIPTRSERERIWDVHISDRIPRADDVDLRLLAEKYPITGGLIKNSVLTAIYRALNRDSAAPTLSMADLESAAAEQKTANRRVLGNSVERHSMLDLGNIILDDATGKKIKHLADSCRNRDNIWKEWGFDKVFPRGNGIIALFSGESGTGKSACAYALADDLGKEAKAFSLPSLLNPYVGESEQNLYRMFEKMNGTDALIILDECDSLLAQKTADGGSVSRMYANLVNIFLEQLERFNGIMVLTTNVKGSIDRAFERRINFRIDFPLPTAKLRERIWRANVPPAMPLAADIDFALLARTYAYTGGRIKNAVITAAYRASSERRAHVSMADFREACELEDNPLDRRSAIGFI